MSDQLALLAPASTISLPAIPPFVVADHFKVGIQDGVVIGFVGTKLKQMVGGLVEVGAAEATLRFQMLQRPAKDPEIIAEFGEDGAGVTLGQMWEVLKAQGGGGEGNLLTDSYTNIFYCHSQQGSLLLPVYCLWFSVRHYWRVDAAPTPNPDDWYASEQVISRAA